MNEGRRGDGGRAIALERLRRELEEHERSGARETPFSAGIREVLADEEARGERAGGSAA